MLGNILGSRASSVGEQTGFLLPGSLISSEGRLSHVKTKKCMTRNYDQDSGAVMYIRFFACMHKHASDIICYTYIDFFKTHPSCTWYSVTCLSHLKMDHGKVFQLAHADYLVFDGVVVCHPTVLELLHQRCCTGSWRLQGPRAAWGTAGRGLSGVCGSALF